MADPNKFAQRIARLAADVEVGSNRVKKKAAVAIDAAAVTSTPVDTGRARSNWRANVGSPERSTVAPMSATLAIAHARSRISTAQPGDEIYISNNVAYIQRLNDGSSRQAPAGFVEEAVAAGVNVVRGARLLDRGSRGR